MPQSRAFTLTLNNYGVLEERLLQDHMREKCVYGIIGHEVGETGTPHLQCYLYYANKTERGMAKWATILGSNRYHIEIAHKSPTVNKRYCSKGLQSKEEYDTLGVAGPNYGRGAVIFEHGVLPVAQNDRWKDAVDILKEGGLVRDVITFHPQIGVTCYKNLKEIRNEFVKERSSNETTALFWFYGPPGSGKSRYAKGIDPDYYKKPAGQWWDETYSQQMVVLMDDFRPTKEFPLEELLNLADYGKHTVAIKGGFRKFNSRMIIITSPLGMRETFQHLTWMSPENLTQLERRITFQCQFPLNPLDAVCLKTAIASIVAVTPTEVSPTV